MSTSDTMHQWGTASPRFRLNGKGAPFRASRVVLLLVVPALAILIGVGIVVANLVRGSSPGGTDQAVLTAVGLLPIAAILVGGLLTVLAKRRLNL